jgi:hypothetical protein
LDELYHERYCPETSPKIEQVEQKEPLRILVLGLWFEEWSINSVKAGLMNIASS